MSDGTLIARGAMSIQSSRLRGVSVDEAGGRFGSEDLAFAEDVNFKLSAVGISTARGYIDQVNMASK